jgi:dTDP-4-amino-4,6-dideoxygalactose transaminase
MTISEKTDTFSFKSLPSGPRRISIFEERGFLPFALPDITEDEIGEVVDSLRSGWLTTGPKTRQFEREFSEFIGEDITAIAVNSATSGLHLALEAVGVGPGDEVITTPFTFTATAEVIRYLGAHPVFVDIDPLTLNIDVSKIENVISSRTKAIIPVHFAGLACEMDEIIRLARRHGLSVIEDAAHAFPSTYQGCNIGALESDATVFSFYATKALATGEGGMITTRNKQIADRCRVMRLHGISTDSFDRYTSSGAPWRYEVIAPGFKYNMTDIAASLGIHQLRRGKMLAERRRSMAAFYDGLLTDLPLKLPMKPALENDHAWHLYVIQLEDKAEIGRDEFISRMTERGISCSVHFIPLHLHPYWRDTYSLKPGDFPCALQVFERCVSLPLYTKMDIRDQMRVAEGVRDILYGS